MKCVLRVIVFSLAAMAGSAYAGEISFVSFTGDSDVGISDAKTYTGAVRAWGGDLAINGVIFRGSDGNTAGNGVAGIIYAFPEANSYNGANGNTGSFNAKGKVGEMLANTMVASNPKSVAVIAVKAETLAAGTTYDARIYLRSWDNNGARELDFSFDEGTGKPVTTGVINVDKPSTIKAVKFTSNKQAYYINYRYTAVEGKPLAITVTPKNNDNLHFYGFSNEVVPPAATTQPAK